MRRARVLAVGLVLTVLLAGFAGVVWGQTPVTKGGRADKQGQAGKAEIPSSPVALQSEIATGETYVRQMITYAMTEGGVNHEEAILTAKRHIEALNIKSRFGPSARKQARADNERGLKSLQDGQLAEALQAFQAAFQAAPADVEIVDNLGYAHLRSGDVEAAEPLFLRALVLAPGRSSAWANLGQTYAKQRNPTAAVACLANAYRFSRNQDTTRQFLQKWAEDDDAKVREVARQTLQLQLVQAGKGPAAVGAPAPRSPATTPSARPEGELSHDARSTEAKQTSTTRDHAYTLAKFTKTIIQSRGPDRLPPEAREELVRLQFGQTSATRTLEEHRRALLDLLAPDGTINTPTAKNIFDLSQSMAAVLVAYDINRTQATKDGHYDLGEWIGSLLNLQRKVVALGVHSGKKEIGEKYKLFAEYLRVLERLPDEGVQGILIRCAILNMMDERHSLTYPEEDLRKLDDFLESLRLASHADPKDRYEVTRPLVPLILLTYQWHLDAETFRESAYTYEAEIIEKMVELKK